MSGHREFFWIYCHVIQHWYVLKDRSKTIHVHRTCSYLYIVLEKEEHVSSSKREDNVSIWKREVHVNIWKREEIVQTKCKQSQSTVPNLLSSHHLQKANNQIHCTRSAHITSLTKNNQPKLLYHISLTSHHWQKANKKQQHSIFSRSKTTTPACMRTYSTGLVPHETAAMFCHVLCTPYNHALCHLMQRHIHKVHACLAVCRLHAAVVTQEWSGYWNKTSCSFFPWKAAAHSSSNRCVHWTVVFCMHHQHLS